MQVMRWFRHPEAVPEHVGVLPGAFNPPTVAHLALARAALPYVDQVLFVLPFTLPHKTYSGASFEDRIDLLLRATDTERRFSVVSTRGGLFAEIARECREDLGAELRVSFLCGADAAQRIMEWDYGTPGAAEAMLRDFELIVAARGAGYTPPASVARRFTAICLDADHQAISATEVRRRIERGEPWRHLVPASIIERVEQIYATPPEPPAGGSGPI